MGIEGLDKVSWIKDLVFSEQQMEESGIVDVNYGLDKDKILAQETLSFMLKLKREFVDLSSAFNELKPSPLGRIKIYGIAKTHADFMLFRNGFKMIFSVKSAGKISIRFNFIGTQLNNNPNMSSDGQGARALIEEEIVETKWGAFGQVIWSYHGLPVDLDHMVRHYLIQFVKESAK